MKITYEPELSEERFDSITGLPKKQRVVHLIKIHYGLNKHDYIWGSILDFPGVEELCKRIEGLSDAVTEVFPDTTITL